MRATRPRYWFEARLFFKGALIVTIFSACTSLRYPDKIVQQHPAPEVEADARVLPPVGNVIPLILKITNRRPVQRAFVVKSVVMLGQTGERFEPFSTAQAAEASGDADLLRSSLPDSGVVSKIALAPVEGLAMGLKVGLGSGAGYGPGAGAIPMITGGVGLIAGTVQATRLALSAKARLETVMLQDTDLPCSANISGYLFYPKRADYSALEIGVQNRASGDTEIITMPWTILIGDPNKLGFSN
jgi:hypothetical protein